MALKHKPDYFVDLDIINPYFRTRALDSLFEEHGIHLVESTVKGMLNSDMPYVSGEGVVPFVNKEVTAIYDLGGTENGAKVLIQFADRITDIENIDFLDLKIVTISNDLLKIVSNMNLHFASPIFVLHSGHSDFPE